MNQDKQKVVADYIEARMIEQGASLSEAACHSTKAYFFSSQDIESLYGAINSGLDEKIVKAIVAHDFNGLANEDRCFAPKSAQFA